MRGPAAQRAGGPAAGTGRRCRRHGGLGPTVWFSRAAALRSSLQSSGTAMNQGSGSLLCKTQLLHVLRYDFFQESFAQQIVGEHLPSTDLFAARGVEMCNSWDCLVVARRCATYVIQTFTLEPVIKTQRGLITS